MATLSIQLNAKLYLRDPQSSRLGQKIIRASVNMIDKNGFEAFTFKKLGADIGSPEASIYRYFENKHRLLLYLIDFYWTCLEHRIDHKNNHVRKPIDRLKNAIRLLAEQTSSDPEMPLLDERRLQRIVNSEFEKTFITPQVDADNKDGLFLPYKSLCKKIAAIIKEVNPRYSYPHTLVSTILLSANHQLYYASHLPSLTDIRADSEKKHVALVHFLQSLVLNCINNRTK